jgi:bis(5'-nucleosidyl)-tetraphosphatase
MSKRAAGIVPLRREPDGWRVLILRVYRNWDFPKGLVDPGEELIAPAIREAEEEADLRDLEFPWGHVGFDTAPYSRGKVATYFVATTARTDVVLPVSTELGRPEHHEGRWVTFVQARALLPERLQPILAAVEHEIA